MTINTQSSKTTILTDGVTTQFAFSFIGVASAYIGVIYTDANGNETVLIRGNGSSQYQISLNPAVQGAIWGVGGVVTYAPGGTAAPAGGTITMFRTLPLTQAISLQNQISLATLGKGSETADDTLEMQLQQVAENIARAIVVPIVDVANPIPLPPAAQRASLALIFDASGQPAAGAIPATGVISSAMAGVTAASSITEARNLLGIAGGAVRMWPNQNQTSGAWNVLDPFGNPIATVGTTTQGLQEAINYAVANGYPLEVWGTGNKGSDGTLPVFITCSTTLQIPANQQWCAYFRDVNITFTTAVNGPGIEFDSCEGSNFIMDDSVIVYQPAAPGQNSFAVLFSPINGTPADHIIGVTGCKFYFSNMATPASGTIQAVIGINISLGGFNTSFLGSAEINGTGTGVSPNAACGILVFGASATTAWEQNLIDITDIHLYSSAGLQIGVSSTFALNYRQNLYRLGGLLGSAGSAGISTYGSGDIFDVGGITDEQGAFAVGIDVQAGAVKNRFRVGQIVSPATAPIINGNPGGGNVFETDGVPPVLVTVIQAGTSGTFVPQPWTRTIEVEGVGGGASGDGAGSGATNGSNGAATTFGGLTGNGGARGAGSGGTATGGDINIQGGQGNGELVAISGTPIPGGAGGNSAFGGAGGGTANASGGAAALSSGSGGAGGGSAAGVNSAPGGSAGGYFFKTYSGAAIVSSYAFAAAGAVVGGSGGTAGAGGGNSGGAHILVREFS